MPPALVPLFDVFEEDADSWSDRRRGGWGEVDVARAGVVVGVEVSFLALLSSWASEEAPDDVEEETG